jgi:hypothetical protein
MAEGALRRHARQVAAERFLHIGVNDAQAVAEAVALGVFLAQHGIAGGYFNSGDMDGGIAHDGTKGGHAGADAGLIKGFAGGAGNGGGEKHRVDAGPVALFGLENLETPAEKAVLGQRRRHIAARRRRRWRWGCRKGLRVHLHCRPVLIMDG